MFSRSMILILEKSVNGESIAFIYFSINSIASGVVYDAFVQFTFLKKGGGDAVSST